MLTTAIRCGNTVHIRSVLLTVFMYAKDISRALGEYWQHKLQIVKDTLQVALPKQLVDKHTQPHATCKLNHASEPRRWKP